MSDQNTKPVDVTPVSHPVPALTENQEKVMRDETEEPVTQSAEEALQEAKEEALSRKESGLPYEHLPLTLRAKISREDFDSLKIVNNRALTESDRIKEEIVVTYKRHHDDIASAASNAREQFKLLAETSNEQQGNVLAQISLDFADIGVLLMKDSKISVSSKFWETLRGHIENDKLLGEATEEKDEHGATVTTFNPYRDYAPYIKAACMRACLVMDGARTKVQIGAISKEYCTGKRFTKGMKFIPLDQIEGDPENYFKAVCVPSNIVVPHKYTMVYDAIAKTHSLTVSGPSDDLTLRYLADDWNTALYNHFFLGQVLQFDLEGKGNKLPTGMISGSIDPATAKNKTQAAKDSSRDTKGSTKAGEPETKDQQIAALKRDLAIERDKSANPNDILRGLQSLNGIARDTKQHAGAFTEAQCRATATLATTVLEHRVLRDGNGKAPSKDAMREWVGLFKYMCQRMEYDDDEGTVTLFNNDGDAIGTY